MLSDCFIFSLYLNQMSHQAMFPTSRLMMKRTRDQTNFWYILVMYGHVLVSSCIPLRLCSLFIFSKLLIFICTSVHFSLLISFFWFFLCFPNSFVFSSSFFLMLNIFPSFLSPHHCIIMMQYVFQSFLSLIYHAKSSRVLWMLIFVRVRPKSQFTIGFF